MASHLAPYLQLARRSTRAPVLAAMLLPAWTLALLPGFFDVDRALPLSAGGPSLWALVATLPGVDALPLAGLAMATAIGAAATLLAWMAGSPPRRERAWAGGLLAAIALPGLLPASTAIDFLPAAAIALIDGGMRRDDRVARWVLAGAAAAIAGLPAIGALAMGWATWRIAQIAIVLPANDNALPPGPLRLYPPPTKL